MVSMFKPLLTAGLFVAGMSLASAAVMPMTYDFEDGDTNGWGVNSRRNKPTVVTDGSNKYLELKSTLITSSTSKNGKRLIAHKHFDNVDLSAYTNISGKIMVDPSTDKNIHFRVGFGNEDFDGYYAVTPVIVPKDGNWYDFSFDISEDNFAFGGWNDDPGATFAEVLAKLSEIRIFHHVIGGYNGGESLNAQVGVDDITLSASVSNVPVPAAAWLMLSGLIGLGGVSARKRNA